MKLATPNMRVRFWALIDADWGKLHQAAVNREKKRRREQLMGKILVKESGGKQIRRAMNSRQYTTERIATHNGANILRQAGAAEA